MKKIILVVSVFSFFLSHCSASDHNTLKARQQYYINRVAIAQAQKVTIRQYKETCFQFLESGGQPHIPYSLLQYATLIATRKNNIPEEPDELTQWMAYNAQTNDSDNAVALLALNQAHMITLDNSLKEGLEACANPTANPFTGELVKEIVSLHTRNLFSQHHHFSSTHSTENK